MSDSSLFLDYELPRHLAAQEPLRHRADARLMVVDRTRGEIEHHHIRDLPYLLRNGDRLVLNDTKVIPAQLAGHRISTGGRWQGLFLQATADGHWRILCKSRGKLAPGEAITLVDNEGRPGVILWLIESLPDGEWLAHPESDEATEDLLQKLGRVPLPPYIRGGHAVDTDTVNYQTVFARVPGAVAAPTAGLHFTKDLLRSIVEHGVACSAITLHVGLGTFRPVSDSIDEHSMHREWGELTAVTASDLNATRAAGGRIIGVGTTVARVLETMMLASRKSASPATFQPWSGETDLFIRPPFEFHGVDALLTNFHFPRTTLLILVQTFGGRELIQRAYQEAIKEEYRFYSYGDAMLII